MGAMDEFLMPDDSRYWWDAIPEPKHLAMLPNTEHSTCFLWLKQKYTDILLHLLEV